MRKIIVAIVAGLVALQAAAQDMTAAELLAKYAATRDKLQSFIMKSRTAFEYDFIVNVERPELLGRRTRQDTHEFRTDGHRFYYRVESWGNVFHPEPWTREKPSYISYLWDGKDYAQVGHDKDHGGRWDIVIMHPRTHEDVAGFLTGPYGGRAGWGYFREDTRVDADGRPARLR